MGKRLSRRFRIVLGPGAALMVFFALSSTAGAQVTLGTTTQPAGSTPGACFSGATANHVFIQATDDPSVSFTVPAGGGALTTWSTNTTGDTPGQPITLVVVRPAGANTYTVVGVDNEVLPTPLPAVATFTLAHPILVQAGDKLGLYSSAETTPTPPTCFWVGGPAGASLFGLSEPAPPAVGQTLTVDTDLGQSPGGFMLDVAATLEPASDLSVTKTVDHTTASVGSTLTYTIKVTNNGPNSAAATTATDTLPSNVGFVSATSTAGTCSHSGATVTCAIGTLASGGSATVTIKATANTTGTATNSVTVSSSSVDLNSTNNTARATTTITVKPLRLTVSPRSASAGALVCYAFKATSHGHAVRGVTVRFAHHTAHTSRHGTATICASLRAGSYHATATKKGFRTAHASVRVRGAAVPAPAPAPAPHFTG